MILIVAPGDDLHADLVRRRLLDAGVGCEVWDASAYPFGDRLSWSPGDGLRRHGPAGFSGPEIDAVWWRRGGRPTVSPRISDENVRRFCAGEARDLLDGVFTTLPVVVNDPYAERRAGLKINQLASAADLGLAIPATIVSSDSDAIREFLRRHPEAIVKTLRSDYPHGIPTRPCGPADFPPLASSFAPAIVQELVVCQADIRVLVVGTEVYAAELRRPDANVVVDWRMTSTGWQPHELDPAVAALLVSLTRRLGLELCSADLRLRPDGSYVFLEVNPSGQFLFLEIDAGLPVSSAVARHLMAATGPAAGLHRSS